MHKIICVVGCVAAASIGGSAAAQDFHGDVHVGVDAARADDFKSTGVTYGISLAYEAELGAALLGAQLDLDASDNSGCASGVLVAGDRACITAKRDSAISFRLGTRLSGRSTLYGLVGYANGRFQAEYSLSGVSARKSEDLNGVRLGAGIETDLSRKWFLKAEYRYTNYEEGLSRHGGLLGAGLRF